MGRREGLVVPQDHHRAEQRPSLMAASSWRRVKETVQAALARPPADRAAFILHSCGDDCALRAEVESLLAAIDQAGSFIDRPALHSSQVATVLADGWRPDDGHRALEPGRPLGAYTI